MAQFMNFFPRQMVMGNTSPTSGQLYSDIFEASPVAQLMPELRVYACSGTGAVCTVKIEDTDDPNGTWSGYADSSGIISRTGTGITTGAGMILTVPRRFLRAQVNVSPGSYMVMHFNARGFC